MDATGMAVLAETASLRERESLIEFFYNHIKPGPSVGVTITVSDRQRFYSRRVTEILTPPNSGECRQMGSGRSVST